MENNKRNNILPSFVLQVVLSNIILVFLCFFSLSSSAAVFNDSSNIELSSSENILLIDTVLNEGKTTINMDSLTSKKHKIKKSAKIDTTHYSPKKAALWALACPGLGQIYNKRYWKLPIVYGLMGTMAYFLATNVKNLRAYNGYIRNSYNATPNPYPQNLLTLDELVTNRDTYRRNVQLSAFGTAFVWGLSIVDAVVDAHLHSFDISDKLSMKIKPSLQTIDNNYYSGVALNFNLK